MVLLLGPHHYLSVSQS
jgi:hypothetical protein